jgi:hypothetical protein
VYYYVITSSHMDKIIIIQSNINGSHKSIE